MSKIIELCNERLANPDCSNEYLCESKKFARMLKLAIEQRNKLIDEFDSWKELADREQTKLDTELYLLVEDKND